MDDLTPLPDEELLRECLSADDAVRAQDVTLRSGVDADYDPFTRQRRLTNECKRRRLPMITRVGSGFEVLVHVPDAGAGSVTYDPERFTDLDAAIARSIEVGAWWRDYLSD